LAFWNGFSYKNQVLTVFASRATFNADLFNFRVHRYDGHWASQLHTFGIFDSYSTAWYN